MMRKPAFIAQSRGTARFRNRYGIEGILQTASFRLACLRFTKQRNRAEWAGFRGHLHRAKRIGRAVSAQVAPVGDTRSRGDGQSLPAGQIAVPNNNAVPPSQNWT